MYDLHHHVIHHRPICDLSTHTVCYSVIHPHSLSYTNLMGKVKTVFLKRYPAASSKVVSGSHRCVLSAWNDEASPRGQTDT